MAQTVSVSVQDAKLVGDALGVDWTVVDIQQFRRGLEVELEHGLIDLNTNVTSDDMLTTGKIALAHLNELSDYYTKLDMIEGATINTSSTNINTTTTSTFTNLALGTIVGAGALMLLNYYMKKD